MSDKLISLESVLKEIRRFKGYIDDDMIERFSIAFKRLPTVPQEMSAREYGETLMKICASHKGKCHKCELGDDWQCATPNERTIPIVEQWAKEHPERSEE